MICKETQYSPIVKIKSLKSSFFFVSVEGRVVVLLFDNVNQIGHFCCDGSVCRTSERVCFGIAIHVG